MRINMRESFLCFLLCFTFLVAVGSAEGPCSSSCGEIQDIHYPFRLKGDPLSCGNLDNELVCSDNKTILEFLSGQYLVTNISYDHVTIQIVGVGLETGSCSLPIQSISIGFLPRSYIMMAGWASVFNCSKKIENDSYLPIPCLSVNNRFVYVKHGYSVQDLLPSCSYLTMIPISNYNILMSGDNIFSFLRDGFSLSWYSNKRSISRLIHECLRSAPRSAMDQFMGKSKFARWKYPFQLEYEFLYCIKHDGSYALYKPALVLVVLLDIAIFIIVLAMLGRFVFAPFIIYVFLAYKFREVFMPMDIVEVFLRNQRTLMPTRYSYIDIIAMTRNFKEKLGQGGFGAVFKGEIPGFQMVAIKMLGNSKCNGEDFINEVSTIGRIHHVNVVRLVGFCSEGSHRALVYELMCNGSLDKHIFSSHGANRKFTIDKLNEIALGVARGIDYLHQGCDMRILHFDIKPHNILLDHNFNPKVSDFGLAKLYPKDYSLVSACAAKGTIGYMAPELVSRSFGVISYKSDVYSFGMLLLEMAGGRRNVDQHAENSSQVYYPSWIYDQLEQREKLEFSNDIEIDDDERKLCKVGLWCIQMRPSDRPSMSEVVEMLEADVDAVEMPPKPFLFPSPTLSARLTSICSSLTEISTIYEDE